MLRCVDLFLVNHLNQDETPLVGWTICFRTIRVGLLSIYILALAYGSGLFRREVVHERWILLVGAFVAAVFLGSSLKEFDFNIEALVAVPLLVLSMVFSFARSWKYLRQSSQVAHHHVVTYRRQLCYLICFGILFPAVYLGWAELQPSLWWYAAALTKPYNLPNWTWWWERIVFWQLNSLWFIPWTVLPWVEEANDGETSDGALDNPVERVGDEHDSIEMA